MNGIDTKTPLEVELPYYLDAKMIDEVMGELGLFKPEARTVLWERWKKDKANA
ncbi:MAG: hypothetical protein V3S55_03955 [Nitrospiraceae bacterium]